MRAAASAQKPAELRQFYSQLSGSGEANLEKLVNEKSAVALIPRCAALRGTSSSQQQARTVRQPVSATA